MRKLITAFLTSTLISTASFADEPINQTHIWPIGTVLMADGAFYPGLTGEIGQTGICFTPVNLPLGATLGSIVIPGNVTVRVGLYAPGDGSSGPGNLDWDLGVTSYSATTGLSSANFPNGSYNAGSGGIHWIATLVPTASVTIPGFNSWAGGAVNLSDFAETGKTGVDSAFLPVSAGSTLCAPYPYGSLPFTPPTVRPLTGTLFVGLYH